MTTYWNAEVYDRIGTPMRRWARALMDDLHLRGDETVLDAGCGSGSVTLELASRLPRGRVIAVDSSPQMIEALSRRVAEAGVANVQPLVADLTEFALSEPVDVVFSNAVFHWIPDDAGLFGSLLRATKPGGRLRAQCGGHGNLSRLFAAAEEVRARPEFRDAFRERRDTRRLRTTEEASAALSAAGWTDVRAETWATPVTFERREDACEYLRTIILRPDVAALAPADPSPYVEAVVEACIRRYGEPCTADYVRLDLWARKPAAV